MNTETDTWEDRNPEDVLDGLDRRMYYSDRYRQPPKLTRKQASAAEREERETAFYIWCMISRYSDYCPFARHD